MPGPISDSYDPEWGTRANAGEISDALDEVYHQLTEILSGQPPIFVLDLVRTGDMQRTIPARLPERSWRLLRFAVERARDSL